MPRQRLDFDSYLNEISKRSHRGGRQADAPGDGRGSDMPVAPSMAGADEAVDWFVDRMRVPGPPPFLFLIGGPGNGKSFLGKRVVEDLNLAEEPGSSQSTAIKAPHKRSYRYRTEHRELLLVNDATFHLDGGFPLMGEVEECIRDAKALVVNVNRGILVEELNSHAKPANGGVPLGSAIVSWASDGKISESDPISIDGHDYRLEGRDDCDSRDFLDWLRIDSPVGEVVVAAAFLDRCSLFELRPDASRPTAEEPPMPQGKYRISRFDKRVEGEVDCQSCGGSLLSEVVNECPNPPDDGLELIDPIRCNLEVLRHEEVRAGVLRIFRAAELLATGSWRMTYRDLWNAIELLIRGRPPATGEPTSPTEWIVENQPRSEAPGLDRLLVLLRLAQSRFHQAIYGARPCLLDDSGPARRTRIVEFLEKADPVRDAISGSHGQSASSDPTKGWASKVLQAFEGGREAGESILEAVSTELDEDDPMFKAVTAFDVELDEVVVHCLDEWGNDPRHKKNFQQLLSWYAEYLLRLYATANGIPAFFRELVAWTEVWDTSSDPQGASEVLDEEVMTLLFPGYPDDKRRRLLVPAFGARAKPLTESTTEPVFAKGFRTPQTVAWRTDGDFLELVVEVQGEEFSLGFDFAILREASACGGNQVGVTDQSHFSVPKLERLRSSMLNAPSAQTLVVERDSVERIGTRHG